MSKGFFNWRCVCGRRITLAFVTLLLLGLFPQASGTQPDYLANSKSYLATYSVTITNISARMDTLEIWIPRPIEWDSQKDVNIEEITPGHAVEILHQSRS